MKLRSDETPRLKLHRADRGHRLAESCAVAMARVAVIQSRMEGYNFQIECHMTHNRIRVLGYPPELHGQRRAACEFFLIAREALEDFGHFSEAAEGGGNDPA